MYNKYTLRGYLNHLEEFIDILKEYKDIDFYKYTIISNNINKRIVLIKEFLDIDYEKPKKLSLNDMLKNNMRFMNRE